MGFIVNKNIEHLISKYYAISERVIYLIIRLNKRYNLQLIHCYAPTTKAGDEAVEQLYEDIIRARNLENTYFTIITGDFNSKLGERYPDDDQYIGDFGLGKRNHRGNMLSNFLSSEGLFCLNTFYKKTKQRKWTWRSPDGRVKTK